MASDEQYFECNAPSVIFERFADETILINLDAGHYYSMDPIGAVIWELVNRALPLAQIAEALRARCAPGAENVAEAVRAYVLRLHGEGLIRVRRTPLPVTTALDVELSLPPGATFSAPVLAKYDDMQEMLLLDPVHDVAETGWPAPAPATDKGMAQIEDDDASTWPSLDDES